MSSPKSTSSTSSLQQSGSDTAPGSVMALLRRGLGRWTALLARIPTLGPAAAAASIPVTLPADGQFTASVGLPADAAAASDTGVASLTALAKRALGNWTALLARVPALVAGRVPVDGSGVTQPVSAAALPLPAGASTAAAQGTGNASLASIDGKVPALVSGRTPVDGSGVTQPVSAAALPLPAGAATSSLQTTGNTALGAPADAAYTGAGSSSIVAALKGLYAAMVAATPAGANIIGKVGIDQTTPGLTNGVVVNASALPAGAAQDATLSARLGTLGQKAMAASTPVVVASDQSRLPADTVVPAVATARSGTIAAGGTAQQLMAANASRRGFVVQNQSSGDLWVNGTSTATADQNSLRIRPDAYYETPAHHVGTGAVSILGATTGQAFYAREF
ncbi:hypothetical protein MFUR16E_20410 [Methylobacterium fujisawaense]|uniref:hypothetical protein n=1 Tax=Methylobacterium fujisawaense TaxID=107400 RepID=UPI002F2BAADE